MLLPCGCSLLLRQFCILALLRFLLLQRLLVPVELGEE